MRRRARDHRIGQRYITVIVDHDQGGLVWAQEGRDRQAVERFFAGLGSERTAKLDLVSSDIGEWITRVIAAECPQATLCLDPFHVVKLATEALDEVPGRRPLAERDAGCSGNGPSV